MGNPYLNRDETIILSTQNLLVNKVPVEAILTNHRLILSDNRDTQFQPQTIPLAAILMVTAGQTGASEPFITLSVAGAGPEDVTQALDIIFTQDPGVFRTQECWEWIHQLEDLSAAARNEAAKSGEPVPKPELHRILGTAEEPGATVIPLATAGGGGPEPGASKSLSTPVKVAVGACIILAVIAVIYVMGPALFLKHSSAPSAPPVPATTVPVTTSVPKTTAPVTTTIAVTPAAGADANITVPATTAASGLPQSGVWVRIQYDGEYNGTVGTSQYARAVNGTGENLYQIPTRNDTIEVSINKLDGSGKLLTVEVFKDGSLVQQFTKSAPQAVIVEHVALPAI